MTTLFEFTCRGCLERKVHKDVYSLADPENRKIYQEVTQLWVNEKDIYTTLCDWCFTQCKNFRTFKAMCTKNDKFFRSEQEHCIEILDLDQGMDLDNDKEDSIPATTIKTIRDTPKKNDIWDCPVCQNKDYEKQPEKTPIIDPKPDCLKCAPKLTLVEHLINHISEDCSTCHEQVVVKQFQRRSEVTGEGESENELSCPVCHLSIKTGYLNFCKHIEDEHNMMWKTFTGDSIKKYPLRSRHKDNPLIVPELAIDKGEDNENQPNVVDDEVFLNSSCQCTCPVCKGRYTDLDEYRDHLREHIQKLNVSHCPICLKLMNRANIFRHIWTIHDTVRFKCKHCPELFKAVSELRAHTEENHLDTFSWICPLCDELIETYPELEDHLKAKHLPFSTCPKCKVLLGPAKDRVTHVVRNHMGRFNCGQCSKGFFTAFEYVEHMKAVFHIPAAKRCAIVDPSINCHLCDRDFNSYEEYQKHYKEEHAAGLKRKTKPEEKRPEKSKSNAGIPEKLQLRLNYKLSVPLSFPLKYTCAACKKDIVTLMDANLHSKVHAPNPNKNVYHTIHCLRCDKLYSLAWGNHGENCS